MELSVRSLVWLLLQAFWAMHLLFKGTSTIQKTTGQNELSSNRIHPPTRIVFARKRPRASKAASNLLLNPNSNSLLKLSDLVTPMEEEMLRCLCAKGSLRSQKIKQLETIQEDCIPRDKFTNVWIDSCCM